MDFRVKQARMEFQVDTNPTFTNSMNLMKFLQAEMAQVSIKEMAKHPKVNMVSTTSTTSTGGGGTTSTSSLTTTSGKQEN